MKYRYFRRSNGYLYKLSEDDSRNTHSSDGGQTWYPTTFWLSEFLDPEYWTDEGVPVEYFPDIEQPGPTYRYFRRGSGEWKVQTTDPDSAEGNFYRNADTPWLSASQSLNDLLANGATEVRASEEQVPRWAVAAAFRKSCGQLALHLLVTEADTEAEAIDIFKEDLLKAWPGALIQQPITIQVS